MARSPNVTVDAQKAIIAGNQNGIPVSVLARQLSLSRRAIYEIFYRNRMRGGVIEGSKSGRPRKTSLRQDNLIASMSKADPRLSAPEINREIKANYSIEVSCRTVQRRRVDAGLLGRRPTKKLFISKKNRSARVIFAKKHQNWTVEDWKKCFGRMSRSLICSEVMESNMFDAQKAKDLNPSTNCRQLSTVVDLLWCRVVSVIHESTLFTS